MRTLWPRLCSQAEERPLLAWRLLCCGVAITRRSLAWHWTALWGFSFFFLPISLRVMSRLCWLRRWGAVCHRSGACDSYGFSFLIIPLNMIGSCRFSSLRLPSWLSGRLDPIRLCTHRRMIISVCSVRCWFWSCEDQPVKVCMLFRTWNPFVRLV